MFTSKLHHCSSSSRNLTRFLRDDIPTVTMVELRKRPAPAAPAPAPKKRAPSKAKAAKDTKDEASKAEPEEAPADVKETPAEPAADASKASKGAAPKVGDNITLEGFGGEIEDNDGGKTTLAKLVADSKTGVVLFTYPKASTPGCETILK